MDTIVVAIIKRFRREVERVDNYQDIEILSNHIMINKLTINNIIKDFAIYYGQEMYFINKFIYDELRDLAIKKRLDLLYKDINSDIVETESSFIKMVNQIEEEKQQDEY